MWERGVNLCEFWLQVNLMLNLSCSMVTMISDCKARADARAGAESGASLHGRNRGRLFTK
jgi:hypothetical protein